MSDVEKDQWYHEERAFRQVKAQGNMDRQRLLDRQDIDTDSYRIDDESDLE